MPIVVAVGSRYHLWLFFLLEWAIRLLGSLDSEPARFTVVVCSIRCESKSKSISAVSR